MRYNCCGALHRWWLKGRCDVFRYLSFIISSLNASCGVRHPRHFLGAPFRRSQIAFISRFESAASWVSRGKYRLARLFRFSTVPFCQGAWRSQNQLSAPMPDLSLRHARNSKPRSKVIDFRADRGSRPATLREPTPAGVFWWRLAIPPTMPMILFVEAGTSPATGAKLPALLGRR